MPSTVLSSTEHNTFIKLFRVFIVPVAFLLYETGNASAVL